jgi:DNA topoisomerase-1
VKLVIVESPTKAKTLSSILDKNYTIKASYGHIRDLPKSGLGVDVENNYQPEYVVADDKKKNLRELKKNIKDYDSIVLATDLDREGEAIAWHLKELLTPKAKKDEPEFERVVFHELTKPAIEEAFAHPTELDMHMVDAQQARRVLDRLVGYKLSPLLWKKVRYGLSAGRVQSVAVRLIVEKERERDAFVAEEYWNIEGLFATSTKETFTAALSKKDGKKLEVKNEAGAKEVEAALNDSTFKVKEVKKSEKSRKPSAPFKTSTMQQAAATAYGMSAKKTMMAAQRLFEKGYITYHRTDSLNLSGTFVDTLRSQVKKEFGANYLPNEPIIYKTKSKNAQEAHEAIRPTEVTRLPPEIKAAEERKVYTLIYKRTMECQMEQAVYDQTSVVVEASAGYEFRASGSVVKFDGWLKVAEYLGFDENGNGLTVLPDVKEGESVELEKLNMEQKFTQPPARYNDASLIKKLEEMGIGRPSTYAPTISTILARKYVRRDGRTFVPEDVAYVVTDLLVTHFPKVVDYEFTADLEEDLDEIATEAKDWVPLIRDFYEPFAKILEVKDKELNKRDVTNLGESDEKCPDCGKPLIYKLGKYGKFLSCSGYPECEFAKPLEENKVFDEDGNEITDFGKCPNCEDGTLILKTGRFGKFLACNNYPKCKTTQPYLEKIGVKCPKCEDGDVIVKKAKGRVFYGCSRYPECDYSSWKKPGDDQPEETDTD